MLEKLRAAFWLVTILCGLCSPAHANTTAVSAAQQATPNAGTMLNGVQVYGVASPSGAVSSGTTAIAANLVRIALLLPLDSDTLGAAAQAVRNGFETAYQMDRKNLTVTVIKSGDAPAEVLAAYIDASARHDMVVGPLTRSGFMAIAQRGVVSKPTIALVQADSSYELQTTLPPNLLAMGLSIEDEARQSAIALSADPSMRTAFVVSGNVAWQKRAARAFSMQWQRQGRNMQSMELSMDAGYVSASGLLQLRQRLQAENPSLLYAALDAGQARQMRSAIGGEVAIYGTSQLNPLPLENNEVTGVGTELDGVHFLDIPWQLQADHPAVMAYPRPVVTADQVRSTDLDRLYALGIDAYRVASEVAAGRSSFSLDGVTGNLSVSFGMGPARFERLSQPAVYQGGLVVPVLDVR